MSNDSTRARTGVSRYDSPFYKRMNMGQLGAGLDRTEIIQKLQF